MTELHYYIITALGLFLFIFSLSRLELTTSKPRSKRKKKAKVKTKSKREYTRDTKGRFAIKANEPIEPMQRKQVRYIKLVDGNTTSYVRAL